MLSILFQYQPYTFHIIPVSTIEIDIILNIKLIEMPVAGEAFGSLLYNEKQGRVTTPLTPLQNS